MDKLFLNQANRLVLINLLKTADLSITEERIEEILNYTEGVKKVNFKSEARDYKESEDEYLASCIGEEKEKAAILSMITFSQTKEDLVNAYKCATVGGYNDGQIMAIRSLAELISNE